MSAIKPTLTGNVDDDIIMNVVTRKVWVGGSTGDPRSVVSAVHLHPHVAHAAHARHGVLLGVVNK